MRLLMSFCAFTVASVVAACSTGPARPIAQKPDADKLLKRAGLPTDFWYKGASTPGKTEDGWDTWIVTGDETPKRAEDGECVAKSFTWVVAIDPKDGHGILYKDDYGSHNPEIGFLLNDDPSRRSVPCDQIDSRDYFLLGEDIQPHQAMMLIHELHNAVECVKQGNAHCGRWKKLGVDDQKDNFLKLPGLKLFMIQWEDSDNHDWVRVQYMLSPVSPDKRPYFDLLDCLVRTLPDDSLELDVTEGYVE